MLLELFFAVLPAQLIPLQLHRIQVFRVHNGIGHRKHNTASLGPRHLVHVEGLPCLPSFLPILPLVL